MINEAFAIDLEQDLKMVGVLNPNQGFSILKNGQSIAIFDRINDNLVVHYFKDAEKEDMDYLEANKIEIAQKAPNGFMPADHAAAINKFTSCRHRSTEEITKIHQTCCSMSESKGYKCNARNLFPVAPSICKDCNQYQSK